MMNGIKDASEEKKFRREDCCLNGEQRVAGTVKSLADQPTAEKKIVITL